jgi:hypothetical protein
MEADSGLGESVDDLLMMIPVKIKIVLTKERIITRASIKFLQVWCFFWHVIPPEKHFGERLELDRWTAGTL